MNRQLRATITAIEKAKRALAKDRDKLRDLISDLEGIADSADGAVEDVGRAIELLNDGADELSKYL